MPNVDRRDDQRPRRSVLQKQEQRIQHGLTKNQSRAASWGMVLNSGIDFLDLSLATPKPFNDRSDTKRCLPCFAQH